MGDPGVNFDPSLPFNCPPTSYFDTWDRQNSVACSATKGLRNAPGENNCFVNCAVQVFWHLDVFRRSYRRLSGHTCMGNSCIFCALKVIFTQFQYSDKASLHPAALRKALADTFANQQRFQLGHMDDAAECFENILHRIHFHVACGYSEDWCTAKHCLPHQKFSMAVYEKVVCSCGASSSPLKFSEMVHYVSTSALVAQLRSARANGEVVQPDRFGLLLRTASSVGDVRECPARCGKQVRIQRTLLNVPDVVSVGLVWDSDHPNMETTTEVAAAIGTSILLQDVYHRVMTDHRKLPSLHLVAVICYYGKHYSTFVLHSKLKTWVYFDDATVKEIGPRWENVVEKCSRCRFQPLLLLYVNPTATPVSVDTAPQNRIMAPGFSAVNIGEKSDDHFSVERDVRGKGGTHSKHFTKPTSNQDCDWSGDHLLHSQATDHAVGKITYDSAVACKLAHEHCRQPSFMFAITGKNDKSTSRVDKERDGDGAGTAGIISPGERRQLFDGGSSSIHHPLTPLPDEGDYAKYTLSSGNQYRRPPVNTGDAETHLPMPPNISRKDGSFRHAVNRDRGVDVVRLCMDRMLPPPPPQQPPPQSQQRPPQQRPPSPQQPPPPPPQPDKCGLSARRERLQAMAVAHRSRCDGAGCGSQHVLPKAVPGEEVHGDSVDTLSSTAALSGLSDPSRQSADHSSFTESDLSLSSVIGHASRADVVHGGKEGFIHRVPAGSHLPPGTPPPEYHISHDSMASRISRPYPTSKLDVSKAMQCGVNGDQAEPGKKLDGKKLNKRSKKEKKLEKEMSTTTDRQLKSMLASDTNVLSDEGQAGSRVKYIDRGMVESILSHQGVHRHTKQPKLGDCVEVDSVMCRLLSDHLHSSSNSRAIDSISVGSHKDSGYGSSDRNSSSSTGSGTVDPYTQYFLTKSMVVPRSFTLPVEEHNCSTPEDNCSWLRSSQPCVSRSDSRKIMHPIRESSLEDMLQVAFDEPIGTKKFILANSSSSSAHPCPPPIPPKNLSEFQIIKCSRSDHCYESSLESLDKEDMANSIFLSLCKKGDSLMDSCVLAETQNDIAGSLSYCDDALGCLKEARTQHGLNSKALTYVQKKYNSCLLKFRTLKKRTQSSSLDACCSETALDSTLIAGNRQSVANSNSDIGDHSGRLDIDGKACDQMKVTSSLVKRDNGTSGKLEDDTYGKKHGGQRCLSAVDFSFTLGDGESGRVNDLRNSHAEKSDKSRLYSKASDNFPDPACQRGPDNDRNIMYGADLYGTLPKNMSRKNSGNIATKTDVYRSFLEKQKCLQASVTSMHQPPVDTKLPRAGQSEDGARGSMHNQLDTVVQHPSISVQSECRAQVKSCQVSASFCEQQFVPEYGLHQLQRRPAQLERQNDLEHQTSAPYSRRQHSSASPDTCPSELCLPQKQQQQVLLSHRHKSHRWQLEPRWNRHSYAQGDICQQYRHHGEVVNCTPHQQQHQEHQQLEEEEEEKHEQQQQQNPQMPKKQMPAKQFQQCQQQQRQRQPYVAQQYTTQQCAAQHHSTQQYTTQQCATQQYATQGHTTQQYLTPHYATQQCLHGQQVSASEEQLRCVPDYIQRYPCAQRRSVDTHGHSQHVHCSGQLDNCGNPVSHHSVNAEDAELQSQHTHYGPTLQDADRCPPPLQQQQQQDCHSQRHLLKSRKAVCTDYRHQLAEPNLELEQHGQLPNGPHQPVQVGAEHTDVGRSPVAAKQTDCTATIGQRIVCPPSPGTAPTSGVLSVGAPTRVSTPVCGQARGSLSVASEHVSNVTLLPSCSNIEYSHLALMPSSSQQHGVYNPNDRRRLAYNLNSACNNPKSSFIEQRCLPSSLPMSASQVVVSTNPELLSSCAGHTNNAAHKIATTSCLPSSQRANPAQLQTCSKKENKSSLAIISDTDEKLSTPCVRALASRFEQSNTLSMGVVSAPLHTKTRFTGTYIADRGVSALKTKSTSEPFRRPKSLLMCKKSRLKSRKSVTFCDIIALHAQGDDGVNSGYESARELSRRRVAPDDRAYHSDDDERFGPLLLYSNSDVDECEDTGSSNSDDLPLNEEETCQLCQKKKNAPGLVFCHKCSTYMSRLKG